MYLLLFGGIVAAYLVAERKKEYSKKLYYISLFAMWCLLSLRYGQGSDYFSYEYILKSIPTLTEAIFNTKNIHSEIGFRILCSFFQGDFKLFIIVVSTFEIYMLSRFIRLYSANPILTLILFFPTYYLTYYFSAIRQGIVIAIFIGLMLPYFHQNKWIQYYLFALVAVLFHSMAVVLLVLPIVRLIKTKYCVMLMIPSFLVGCFFMTTTGQSLLGKIPMMGYYASDMGISWLGLLERSTMLVGILILYFSNSKDNKQSELDDWIKINVMGMCIYLALFPYALIAARIMVIFKVVEVVIYPSLLKEKKILTKIAVTGILMLSSLMVCKNLQSYVEQGNYFKGVEFYNYPYISIFNEERIWYYRALPGEYNFIE